MRLRNVRVLTLPRTDDVERSVKQGLIRIPELEDILR
jgi:hypothetical protein